MALSVVFDKNMMESPDLEQLLAGDADNRVVTDIPLDQVRHL